MILIQEIILCELPYHSKYDKLYEEMDKFSQLILDIKKDEKKLDTKSCEYHYYKVAIDYFIDRLYHILSDTEEYVICVIPSHAVGTAPSGIRTIAKQLCTHPIIDRTNLISRVFEMPKKSMGGPRNLKLEIESIAVRDESIIRDRQILLLDDVTTTGTSLKAGKYILEEAGAKIVTLLALSKTQRRG